MKNIILALFSLFIAIGCSTSDDKPIENNNGIIGGNPLPPNRGYNLHFALRLEFKNVEGVNIFDSQNPIVEESDIDVDVYGINGYEDEYPYPQNYPGWINVVFRDVPIGEGSELARMLVLMDYTYKYPEMQNLLNERKWMKYKVTFPDGTIYEIKVEADLLPSSNIDYYPTKIYINDELKWVQPNPQGIKESRMTLTIVK